MRGLLVLLVWPALAQTTATDFRDGGFPLDTWQILPPFASNGQTSGKVSRQPANGSGAYQLQFDMSASGGTKQNPADIAFAVINTKAIYTPAVQGPLASIDYSEEGHSLSSPSAAQNTGPALRQNGKIYVLRSLIAANSTQWTPVSQTGITADLFVQLTGTSGSFFNNGSHPDFSGAGPNKGATIEFGMWRGLESTDQCSSTYYCYPNNTDLNSSQGVDSWHIVLHQATYTRTNSLLPNPGSSADPVSTATGEYYEESRDASYTGGLLSFSRYYATFLLTSGVSSALGANWMHNFDLSAVVSGADAWVTLFRGRRVHFTFVSGAWQPDATDKIRCQFASASGGYQFLEPLENRIYSFSSTGQLTSIADRNGNAVTITRSASSPGPDSVSDNFGHTLSFVYSAGMLAKVQDQGGRTITFTHLGNDLTAVTGFDGKTTSFSYTPPSLLNSKTLADGSMVLRQTFDAKTSQVTAQTDSRGQTTKLATDATGKTTITTPSGVASSQTNLAQANLTGYTDGEGASSALAYDKSNRFAGFTDRLGDSTSFTYQPETGRVASITNAAGYTNSYAYASQTQALFNFYNAVKWIDANGNPILYGFDSAGNVLSYTDVIGAKTVYTYNPRGQMTSYINPSGAIWTYTYASDGTKSSETNPSGGVTTYTYDNQKRVVGQTNPDTSTLLFSYDSMDHLVSSTNEIGKTITSTYDIAGNIASVTDANQTLSATRDGNGRVTSVQVASGKASVIGYDPDGRIQQVTAPTGEPVQLAFSKTNRLTGITDCQGFGIGFAWNKEGALNSVADGGGVKWNLNTDQLGLVTRVTSPSSRAFAFTWDKTGRLIAETDALNQVTAYTRDAAGRLVGVSAPGGLATAIARDSLGHITSLTDPAGNAWKRTYDAQGRLKTETDPLGRVTSYAYDSRNRRASVITPEGSLAFTYNGVGDVIRRLYSDGTDLHYTISDSAVQSAGDGFQVTYDFGNSVVASNGLLIGRDASYRMASVAFAPGKAVQYAYDCRGLLSQITDWAGGVTQFTWDNTRRMSTIQRANGVITQYGYDADGRLTAVTESLNGSVLSSVQLTCDAAGRITSANRNVPQSPVPAPGTIQFTYDAANQRTDATYDGVGRPTQAGGRTYTWDGASRLTSYSGPDGAASFTYDGTGMRIASSTAAGNLSYVWNFAYPLPSISVLRNDSGDYRYIVALPGGELLYTLEAADNSRHFFHFDEMGSTVFLSDDGGNVTDTYDATPYGEQVDHTGSSDNPFTWQGQWGVMQEGSTGLFLMGLRYYDSASGRFLTKDPAPGLDPKTSNPYQFALENPLGQVDPMGEGAGARRQANRAESEFGQFVLGLRIPIGPPGKNETAAPRLARRIFQFLYGQPAPKETSYE